MKLHQIGYFSLLCLLLAGGLPPNYGTAAQPRPVAEEFQAKLAKIAPASNRQPEALSFPAINARFVRVAIHATSGNSEPCIDEIEMYGPDGKGNHFGSRNRWVDDVLERQ